MKEPTSGRRRIGAAALLVLALFASAAPLAAASCPTLLMYDGLDIKTQTNAEQARYWGQTVGVQGFFINHLMADWPFDVGTDANSARWQQVSRFQSIYAKHGVTDNFIKVALYKPHDWRNAKQNQAVVRNFAHAAALAKYAGLKGMALDLEPYKPIWDSAADGPDMAATVEREGRAIGNAMHAAYPDITLIVLPDVLHEANPDRTLRQKLHAGLNQLTSAKAGKPGVDRYKLAVPFVRGLLSVPWKQVVLASEQTYSLYGEGIARAVPRVHQNYATFMDADAAAKSDLSMAPGLWPLGRTGKDKSARETPEKFEQRLRVAFKAARQYVWIYGKGSAWQTDGPYAKGAVVANFNGYLQAIQHVRASCQASAANGH